MKFENLILIMLIIFGVIFTFMNTPLDRYDEHGHFWRAYEISCGNIKSDSNHVLPDSIIELFFDENGGYPNRNFDYETLREKIEVTLDKEQASVFDVGSTSSYGIFNYVPSIVGVFVGRILELRPIIIFYLGRLTNLASYIIVVYFALKIVPNKKFKYILGLISVFPMCINLAASYSPDAIIISFAIMSVAYILKLKFDPNIEKIGLKHILLFTILAAIPTICKIVYVFLFGLLFIIPKEKFDKKYERIGYFVLQLVVFVILYFIFSIILKGQGTAPIEKNPREQFLYCIANPVVPFQVLLHSLDIYSVLYLEQMVGGWNTPEILSFIVFLILLVVVLEESEENKKYSFRAIDRGILIVISIIQILAVFAALYLDWSTAKSDVIIGIQGRYFIPILPTLLIGINTNAIKLNLKNKKIIVFAIIGITYLLAIIKSILFYI